MAALPDDETIECFGRALYGDAWISSLTERERWLLDKYERYWVDPPATKEGTNLFAGGITWTDVEYDERIRMVRGRWLILPSDPALAREVEEAVSRRDRIDDQRSEVSRQLQNGAGFPPAVRQGGEAQQARPKKALADWQAEGRRSQLGPPLDHNPDAVRLPVTTRQGRGPERGKIRRYAEADRALYSELEKLIANGNSKIGAAKALALQGNGTPESRAKRLLKQYREDHKAKKLADN